MTLEYSTADIIRYLLFDLGLGTDPTLLGNWPVQVSNEPDSPDNLIVVFDTAGVSSGRIQRSGEVVEQRGFMIQVRGTDHQTAWIKAEAIRSAIEEDVHNTLVQVESTTFIVYVINRHSGPIFLGREPGTNRVLFTINAVAAINNCMLVQPIG